MRANLYALTLCLLLAMNVQAQYYFLDGKITTTKTIGSNPYFGHSVAVSGDGNTMMIGATLDSSNRGTVFVYKKVNGAWVDDTTLTPIGHFPYPVSSSYTNYGFGSDIAISFNGNIAIIGRAGDNAMGAVWVWERDVNGQWSNPAGRISIPNPGSAALHAAFGLAIDISDDGNTAVVGAPIYNNTNGIVYVMTRANATTWYVNDLPGGGGNYGNCVAISGNAKRIAIGGPVNGRMDYFDYGTSGWTYKGYFGYTPPVNNNYIGSAFDLSYSGDTLAIGAINFGTYLPGAVTLAYNGTSWSQFGGDIKIVNSSSIGMNIKISNDGRKIAMGLPYENNDAGGVAVTELDANGNWKTPLQTIGGPAIGAAHQGIDIAMSADGGVLIAGAYADNNNQGAAYLSEAAVPQITTGNINGSPFCESTSYNTSVTFITNIKSGTFNAEISDYTGSFLNAQVIGTNSSSPIQATIPSAIAKGSKYRIRVKYAGYGTLNADNFAGTDNGTDLQVNTCPPSNINEADAHFISVYPNPVSGALHISNLEQDADYCLYNTVGTTVQKGTVNSNTGTIHMNVPEGSYFLQLTQKGTRIATLMITVE